MQGQVAGIGTLGFGAPAVEQGARTQIDLRLIDARGATLAANYQDVCAAAQRGRHSGRLLVSAFQLSRPLPDHPVARVMLRDMMA